MAIEKIDRVKHKVVSKQTSTITSFVSGVDHPVGLKCKFYVLDNDDLVTTFTLNHWHEGHVNMGHGGTCYAVLDELLGRANRIYDDKVGNGYVPVVTGELTCRYVSPAPLFEPLYAYGRIENVDGRKRYASGEVMTEDGRIIIRCKGVYLQVPHIPDDDRRDVPDELSENDPAEI